MPDELVVRGQQDPERWIAQLLRLVGEDSTRPGLKETPSRVIKAWREMTVGYAMDPMSVMKTFEDGAEGCDQMVVVRDLPFYSNCEHHMLPFFGTVTVGYLPVKKIAGLSKLGRLVEVFARRLQVQERLTNQIADALVQGLAPKGVGVIVNARHMCMEARGYNKQGHSTLTSALRGDFLQDSTVRSEFMSLR